MPVTIAEFQQGTLAYISLEVGLLLIVQVLIVLLVLCASIVLLVLWDGKTVHSSVLCITSTNQ